MTEGRDKHTRVTLTRRYHLPALHILSGSGFSPRKNREVFGGCSRLHGHDYGIEVTITGPVHPTSGLLFSRDAMDRFVREGLLDRYTGTNLSDHFDFTTGEALALEFYALLQPLFPEPIRLHRVRVLETRKNSFIAE